MDVYQPERRRKGRARERYAARQVKQMVTRRDAPEVIEETPVMTRAPYDPGRFSAEILKGRALVASRDAVWYLRHNTYVLIGVIGLIVAVAGLFLGVHLIGGRIFPNVWALGVNIGDMTAEEAASTLQSQWASSLHLTLRDGDRTWSATPAQLGLKLDATATAQAARQVGLAGIPLGYGVLPVVNLDIITTQNYLLDLTEQSKILPYNAGYRWQGDQLVGVEGTDGRFLDVAATMADLQQNLPLIAASGQFDLTMTTMPPDVRDPSEYLDQARAFASQNFMIKGYDPFTDETFAWTTDRGTLTSWLEVHKDGLGLREDVFASFVQAQTNSLAQTNPQRYVEPLDSMSKMSDAIKNVKSEVDLRVRYRSTTDTVQAGDSGYMIARRNGIPFYNLQQANPGRDWDQALSIGEEVNLPSPDITIPIDPIPNKRIVVNLKTQSLVAYENGQPIFSWLIASGMDYAPTNPGIYEIISHDPEAKGGSYELCSSLGCAQWTMYWFMGIYEVIPGLVNGFHGAVLLPSGRYLGDGLVGRPLTYGCIMSDNDKAKALYDWAQEGTIVEIISPVYQPRSELGRRMLAGNQSS
jgi:LysM repeat protein